MALILNNYRKYFYIGEHPNEKRFFDPKERRFFYACKENSCDRAGWIEIFPVNELELYRRYLLMNGFDKFVQLNANLPKRQFILCALEHLGPLGTDDAMKRYVFERIEDVIYDWAVNNQIENWKLKFDPPHIRYCPDDAYRRSLVAHYKMQAFIENEDERIFRILSQSANGSTIKEMQRSR